MKKRIGWLNNKPIIQGDKNLKTSNELHISEVSGGENSGGGDSNETIYYYKTKRNQSFDSQHNLAFRISNTVETLIYNDADGNIITPATVLIAIQAGYGDGRYLAGFAISDKKTRMSTNPDQGGYVYITGSIEERIEQIIQLIVNEMGETYETIKEFVYANFRVNEFYENCTQITKEEYEALITYKPE